MPIVSAFRSLPRTIGILLASLISPLTFAQSAAADGFDPNVNGNVYTMAIQPDGKILIGGTFSSVQPNGGAGVAHNNIARLLPDGRNDPTFTSDVNGQISAIVVQADGKIVIGGKFSQVEGATRNRAARLNSNGTLDATFDPNLSGGLTPDVTSLALQSDGKIVIGGGFTTAGTTTRNRIARFNANGSLDTSFDPNANGMVLSLAVQPDGKILVGGGFTTLQPNGATGTTARNRVARLNPDGSIDGGFDPNADNAVSAIALQPDGLIVIGGNFTQLQPNGAAATSKPHVARLHTDGSLDGTFGVVADGNVSALLVQTDGRILAGGATVFNGFPYIARLLPDGSLDGGFVPTPNFNVYAFVQQADGSIVLGGGFTTLRGYGVASVVRNHVARVTQAGALDADFRPDVNGRLRMIALQSDGMLLVGGTFTSVGGATHNGLVRFKTDGSVDANFKADVNGNVAAILQQSDGKILIGGLFSLVDGTSRSNLARLNADGSLDTGFTTRADQQVSAFVIQTDGKILIGGAFTSIVPTGTTDATAHNFIARLNADGTLDSTFTGGANAPVNALAMQADGKLLVGGSFNTFQPTSTAAAFTRYGIVRLNTDATVDTAFNPNVNGTIYSIAVQTDNKIVFGGSFQQLAPPGTTTAANRSNIARINADSTLDTSFDPGANNSVFKIVQSNGKLFIGGLFTALKSNSNTSFRPYYVARLNDDGKVDTTFDATLDVLPGNEIFGIAPTADNHVYIGGAFTAITHAGVTVQQNRLARLGTDGTVDTGFNPNSATGAPIEALTLQVDGRIFAAGAFTGIGGTRSTNLAQFFADGSPNTQFTPILDGPVHAIAQLPTKGEPISTPKPGFAWLDANGQLRSGFTLASTVGVAGVTAIVVQPDHKILLGGDVSINSVSAPIIRINPDGTPDASFQLVAGSAVNAIALQGDGKILIGGTFTSIAGQTRSYLARLNADGSFDSAFYPILNNDVTAIAVQSDGKIIITGDFTFYQPSVGATTTARSFVARLNADGTLDTGFNPSPNANVQALQIQPDGKILISGFFTALTPNGASTATSRSYLARLNADGTLDSMDFAANGVVSDFALQSDGKIVICGAFSTVGGVNRNYIARLNTDGSTDAGFNPNPNSTVAWVAVQSDQKIIMGGQFTELEPNPSSTDFDPTKATPRSHIARLNSDGTIDPAFNPNFDSQVLRVVAFPNGAPGVSDFSVIVAGSFATIQPTGSILIGGSFGNINGVPISNFALFSSDGSISSTFQPNPNGAVYAVKPLGDDRIVVAGSFTTISGAGRNHIALFSADYSLSGFDPNVNGDVYAVVVQPDGKLLIGGSFNMVGGTGRNNLARLNADGSLDNSFSASTSGAVHTILAQPDGRVVVTEGTTSLNALVRFNADGSSDSSFNPANNGAVLCAALQADGKIVVGGSFTAIGGGSQSNLARLNANGTLDPSLTAKPSGAVSALTIEPDGKIVIGGTFNAVDDLPRFGIARIAPSVAAAQSFLLTSGGAITWSRGGSSPEIYAVVAEGSADALTWNNLGQGTRISGTSNWQLPTGGNRFVRATALVASSPNSSAGLIQTQALVAPPITSPPVITSATAVNAASGTSFIYAITATGNPTSYSATGLPPGLDINASSGVISGTPTQTGTFTVTITATNPNGSGTTALTIIVGAPGSISDAGRLVNLSVLAQVISGTTAGTTANPIIAGFVISGSSPQNILLRAVGPGLSSMGVTSVLAAPELQVYNSAGQVISDTNSWGGSSTLSAEFARLGAFALASTSADAAVLLTLSPGPYTLHVNGTTDGTALAEIYDASATPAPVNPHLVNISARGIVDAGHHVTGGFVITGSTPKQMLVRGVGPGLAAQGVTSVLSDPTVTLYKIGTGAIAQNDNWGTPVTSNAGYPAASPAQISAAATTTGAFAYVSGSLDSAILITLAPGLYTAEVTGTGGATGAAMVEVYEVP